MTAHAKNLTMLSDVVAKASKPAHEYKCDSCGEYSPMTLNANVCQFKDQGEWFEFMICDECRVKGKHELLMGM